MGAGPEGFRQLKQHEFFAGVNFGTLRELPIAPEIPLLEEVKHGEQVSSGHQSFASEDAMNYAIITPQSFYCIDYKYFAESHPMGLSTPAARAFQAKPALTVKEG